MKWEHLSWLVQFFLPSPSGIYGWVSCTIFGWWTIGEVNWQAGQANKQAFYLNVYEKYLLTPSQYG